ncbi:MAG: hypothetical protein ACYTFT_16710, partial [Planctomycetota bacterium]
MRAMVWGGLGATAILGLLVLGGIDRNAVRADEGQAPTFVPTAKSTAPASNRVSLLPIGWVDAVKQTLMQTRDRAVARRNAAENVQEGPGWTEP